MITTGVTLDILIASIPHRHSQLLALLEHLDRQSCPGFGAIVYRDNLEASYGAKSQALLEASAADYVVFVDDDDWVAPKYVSRVMDALKSRPDYVGYSVRWTVDGHPQRPVIHSLQYPGWQDRGDFLLRDITHKNPIRRDLALLGRWEGGFGADGRWADQVRATNRVRKEEFIAADMYEYRYVTADEFRAARLPVPAEHIRPLPEYGWLRYL